ncbi:hypothetical protein LTR36_005343 [Oleoguttula mirabilis]|uniref:Fatty acid hydroxylase domain-containing protein n=1 Tax=Oleoguttula mirabilis TaxID=1507867 RepID=A0AAV9JFR6_9PEZI|nr:hypothetical protein LTR36_005343 [Oleoguttula mirabilis]
MPTRDLSWVWGYAQGRFASLPHTPSELCGQVISKAMSFVALPIPLLSFLALPLFGGSSTTVNLVVFYLTWSALVASHGPLTIELGGTLLVRLVCFLLPALGFLAFDCTIPSVAKGLKAQGEKQLPLQLGRNKVLEVVGVAVFNVLLSVAVQAGLEHFATQVLHLRSILKVTSIVPLPWTVLKDVAKGLVFRGVLRYAAHRYLLHTYRTPLKGFHRRWQHSVRLPFSLVAAYDHPLNYLLSEWLPVFFPAYLFRFHALTWHVLLAVVSLEELFVYSGYAVLPSSIVLAGMARRTDAHFKSSADGRKVGNFGHLGLLDFVCGTTCKEEVDVMDDLQSEAGKHQLQKHAEKAVQGALAGFRRTEGKDAVSLPDDTSDDHPNRELDDGVRGTRTAADHELDAAADAVVGADGNADDGAPHETQRKSGRRKAQKA